ncbi:hypothetical protein [Halorubrum kocurii]|uniref:Hemolytic protein HlpA-like protein n=1 Tax=Halorubrum kocurii JCM 14978 TaxID=1230456 RepID=M0P6V3_9EURY|nr:hypothetical protein [Halorubrum kocurii]EMA65533.1 hemolytic protein HlpA-like protein [Halorubrum kocurii JCM 14978]
MSGERSLSTPVALFAFNRPDTTAQVFEQIRAAEPPELCLVADGPRPDHPDDEENCEAVRTVLDGVDWDCEVHRLYRETNVGMPEAVYTGLDWVFERVPEAIILEDDTVPNADFFRFCETMLDRYRGDARVMMVNGTNRLETWRDADQTHHFVTWQDVWGWATWRDAWREYDPDIDAWGDPEVRARIADHVADGDRADYHADLFDSLYEGRVTGWSRAWRFAMFRNGGLSVVPARNLVTNVGFDERGHYATDPDSPLAGLPRRDLRGPYEERATVIPDREYERECFDRFRRTHPALRALSLVPNPALALVPNSLKRTVADRIT